MGIPVAKTFSDVLYQWAPMLALVLQALLLSRFLNARNRNYPLAIVYSILLFSLTSIAILWQSGVAWLKTTLPPSVEFQSGIEVLMHVVLLLLMLQLIHETHKERNVPTPRLWALAGLSIVVFLATIYWVAGEQPATRFIRVRQVMSFFMVLLNLYWWTLLLGSKNVGRRILLLSAGIGLQMTGQVVSDGIFGIAGSRPLSFSYLLAGAVMYVAHFCSLGAWYEAFHTKNAPRSVAAEPGIRYTARP
jgi:hypothetical protein